MVHGNAHQAVLARAAQPAPRARPRRSFAMFAALALLCTLWLGLAAWCVAAFQIVSFARSSATGPADAALVLGAAAWGNRPSPVYQERISQAIQLYQSGQVRWIILTGGTARLGEPSEAEVGRRFCVRHGVPEAAILEEESSRTTWENLQGARAEMSPRNIHSVLLVSDPLHMKRAVVMARAQGIDAQPAPTTTSRFRSRRARTAFLWREGWLYIAFRLFGIDH
jgi:uncharacterized SAM-binding protein YcdF (DUF218 family)